MEGTHGKLGTGLADGLGRDDADRFALADRRAHRQVDTVAVAANAGLARAGIPERMRICTRGDAGRDNGIGIRLSSIILLFGYDDLAGLRVDDVVNRVAAEQTLAQAAR